jgi:hypothetical protein
MPGRAAGDGGGRRGGGHREREAGGRHAAVAKRIDWLDDRAAQRPEVDRRLREMKTVWHPIGL